MLKYGESDIMKRPARPMDELVINRTMRIGMVVQAVVRNHHIKFSNKKYPRKITAPRGKP